MDDLTTLSISEFLEKVAERTPTPGGGAVAALAGALSCAMAHMVASYSAGKRTEADAQAEVDDVRDKLHGADELMRALITADGSAYMAMTRAAGDAKTSAAAQRTYQDAVMRAIGVPMEMAALACSTLSTLGAFKESASRFMLSDLGVAAVLAAAAARAAVLSVRVNAREISDVTLREKIIADADDIVARCTGHLDSIEAYVGARL
ncbi:MAG: cyclodeaminase/cyclohydrolase family protein [Phycisphaerae bacterium]